jgi:hypothetical protein
MISLMRYLLPLLLVSCGGAGREITLSVVGVGMADVEAIRADLARLKGVSDVRPGALKDGRAEFRIAYAGDGAALAADLARLGSGLKNVTGFDASSVQVAWGGREAPSAPDPTAASGTAGKATEKFWGASAPVPAPATSGMAGKLAAAAAGPTLAPAPVPAPVAAPAPTPSPAPVQAAPAEKPEEKKEIKVEVKKDPLAYKVHQLEGGTIATFEGWKIQQVPNNEMLVLETHPDGKENDFQMLILATIQSAEEQGKLFEDGPAKLRQLIPTLQPKSEAQKATFGGDEGRVQDWAADVNGRSVKVQTIFIRKKDVAVGLVAFGTDETFKTYGRALGITAQSITVKESPPDPALLGTWHFSSYYSSGTGTSNQFSHTSSRSITVYPNGTFTEVSMSSSNLDSNSGSTSAYLDGGNRGRVVKRGTLLTFTYDNGKVWNTEYKLDGGALLLNGNLWTRQ